MDESRRSFVKNIGLILAGGATLGLADKVRAQSGMRFIESYMSPAAFGFGGESIDPTQFKVDHYATNDPDLFLQVFGHATQPQNYMQMRRLVRVPMGETGTIDNLVALPNEGVGGDDLGNVTSSAEILGTGPGISNIYELFSGLGLNVSFFSLPEEVIGTKTFAVDLDSGLYQSQIELVENAVDLWKDMPAGFNIGDLAAFTTYHGGPDGSVNPDGYSPGSHKVFKVVGDSNAPTPGNTNLEADIITYKPNLAGRHIIDGEMWQANTLFATSVFAGQEINNVPDAFKKMVGLHAFTTASDQTGAPIIYLMFGGLTPDYPTIFGSAAELGEGFPGVTIGEIAQRDDRFDSNGYVLSAISEPVVRNSSNISWGSSKALYR